MRRRPSLSELLNDPTIRRLVQSIVEAYLNAHDEIEDLFDLERRAHKRILSSAAHFCRIDEIVQLPAHRLRDFKILEAKNRVALWREDLRIEIMALTKQPQPDPATWSPNNRNGWPPSVQTQLTLDREDHSVPFLNHVVFVCAIPDGEGVLQAIDMRAAKVDENGYLFGWDEILPLWEREEIAPRATAEPEVHVAVKRKKPTLITPGKKKPKARPKPKKRKTDDDSKE